MSKNQRFTSLFFSDIVGYSQMIANDESHALNLLEEHDIILKKYISQQDGKIIKHIGDAIFAEFLSQRQAIEASILIQRHLTKRNANYAQGDMIKIRIGLHCGTVVEKDKDLFGNDVNLCARIEACAIPGGIACSIQMIDGLDIKYKRSYGYVRLKNIPNPQKLYRLYSSSDEFRSENEEQLQSLLSNQGIKLVDSNKPIQQFKTFSFLYPDNLGNEKYEFLCFEFLKQLISDSNKVPQIRASSINDIMKYRYEKDISLLSTKLASEYIVEIRLHSTDSCFSVDVDVIYMNNLKSVYTNSFKGDINELKNISGKILLEIFNEFSIKIDDDIKSLFKQEVNVDNEAYKLFLKGKSLSDQISGSADLQKSKKILESAIDIDDNFPEAYAGLGMTYKLLGEFEDAEEMLDEAIELMQDLDNPEVFSMINNYFGIYYRDTGNPKKSIRFFDEALKFQKKIGDELLKADIYNNMSASFGLLNDNKQMINLIVRAQKIYSDYDESLKLANSYGMEANYYMNSQDHQKAILVFEKAKSMFFSEELYFRYTQCLVLQSQCYIVNNLIDEARNNLEEALKYSDQFENPMMDGKIFFNLAQIYMIDQEYDLAEESIDESIDVFEQLNNKVMLSQLYIMKGNLFVEINKLKKAERSLKKAKKYSRRIESNLMKSKIKELSKKINE